MNALLKTTHCKIVQMDLRCTSDGSKNFLTGIQEDYVPIRAWTTICKFLENRNREYQITIWFSSILWSRELMSITHVFHINWPTKTQNISQINPLTSRIWFIARKTKKVLNKIRFFSRVQTWRNVRRLFNQYMLSDDKIGWWKHRCQDCSVLKSFASKISY